MSFTDSNSAYSSSLPTETVEHNTNLPKEEASKIFQSYFGTGSNTVQLTPLEHAKGNAGSIPAGCILFGFFLNEVSHLRRPKSELRTRVL